MHRSAGPEDRFPPSNPEDAVTEAGQTTGAANRSRFGDQSRVSSPDQSPDPSANNASRVLGETDLDSALQLLVERAQYITGATGTALAVAQGEEMVCRASAGSSAPAVGARLQVRSGLTGESISRRQLLRCDNAETDPRVNLEACRARGIASIVVLPLLRRSGEVRGLFELFSDHPYAFEERDLVALERMADLTLTALDLAEQRPNVVAPVPRREPDKAVESAATSSTPLVVANPPQPEIAEPAPLQAELPEDPEHEIASIPEAILRTQKCSSCGFPVSEGRTLCLDCEKKESEKIENDRNIGIRRREKAQSQIERDQIDHEESGREVDRQEIEEREIEQRERQQDSSTSADVSVVSVPEESVPAFLDRYATAKEPWLTNPVNLLAIVVLILGILVAVVVFR
jgi:putative methionine-R-sulfoxide reductase with GAF domain